MHDVTFCNVRQREREATVRVKTSSVALGLLDLANVEQSKIFKFDSADLDNRMSRHTTTPSPSTIRN